MIINVINRQSDLKIRKNQVKNIVRYVIAGENQLCDEVNIFFVNTPSICKLHEQFFQDPSPTDCISFPLDEEEDIPYRILGEVFVCPETAIKYAEARKKNPYEETTLYIIHGLLHLMGYDDLNTIERKKMIRTQTRYLTKLLELNLIL